MPNMTRDSILKAASLFMAGFKSNPDLYEEVLPINFLSAIQQKSQAQKLKETEYFHFQRTPNLSKNCFTQVSKVS